MKFSKLFLSASIIASSPITYAAEPAPVINVANGLGMQSSPDLAEQVISLERKLVARNRAQVNVQRQLDELQNEVNELRGVTEFHSHQLAQVLERQRELYQELDRRVSAALKPKERIPAAIIAPKGTTPAYSSDLTENEAYDHAVNLVLRDKNYEKAIPEFQAFNQKYPNSTYAANAHYWLGQLLFNKGDFVQAQVAFNIVVEQFLDSTKRSDALQKLAMVAQKQNNKVKAISLYQQLIKEYPDSTAAQLASPRLNSLEEQ
jgi:tol-pal system protein YbgF